MSRDTNFYYSFLVLPPDKRRAIVAVWDFCRAVDDAADEPGSGTPAGELAKWRGKSRRGSMAARRRRRKGRALAPLVHQFHLPRACLRSDHRRRRDGRRRPALRDVRRSLSSTASGWPRPSGLVCLEIFGYRDPGSRQYATDLGVALQLTNILRDVAEDLRRGRVYLPQEDLRAHGVTEADLRAEADRAGGRGARAAGDGAAPAAGVDGRVTTTRAPIASCRASDAAPAGRGARSWAPSTAPSSIASSGATTTCSRPSSACPGRGAP